MVDDYLAAAPSAPNWEAEAFHPARRVFHQGILSVVALTTPVFAVLYWLTIGQGSWPIVLTLHVLVLVCTLFAALGYFFTVIQVTSNGLRERGFFGHISKIPFESIGSVLTLEAYLDTSLDTQLQLFVCGRDDKLLLRMRGQFWTRDDMERLASLLDVPHLTLDHSVTLGELRRTRPELLYWFERLIFT